MANLVVPHLPIPDQGMNLEMSQHAIPDNQLFYAQDVLFDMPGRLRSRGILRTIQTSPPTTIPGYQTIGISSIRYRDGNFRVAVFFDQTPGAGVFQCRIIDGTTGATLNDLDLASFFGVGDHQSGTFYYTFDAKPALGGGRLIAISIFDEYNTVSDKPTVYYWLGASKPKYSTGTIAVTANSPIITGTGTTFTGNVEPGMFLYSSGTYIGVVKSVDSGTQITLENNPLSPSVSGIPYQLHSFRTLAPTDSPWITDGTATTNTSSTTVTGGNTKWRDQGVSGSTYYMFRASDMVLIGTVSAVNSNTSLTLTANAAIALDGEEYVLIRQGGGSGVSHTSNSWPRHHAFWRGYQFLANWNSGRQAIFNAPTSRRNPTADPATVFIRGPRFLDEGDPSTSGSFIVMQPSGSEGASTAIKGLAATTNSLLVYFANETQMIVGNTPDDFSTRPLINDGLLSSVSVVPYKDGVVWAGRRGVYYFDGVSVHDLTAGRIKRWYQELISKHGSVFTSYALINSDHFLICFPNIQTNSANATSLYQVRNNAFLGSQGAVTTLSFNLISGAVGVLTNLSFFGHAQARDSQGANWLLVQSNGISSGLIYLLDADYIFDKTDPRSTGSDVINTTPSTTLGGPNLYIESKAYDMGDPERKKLFRQMQINLDSANGNGSLNLEVYAGVQRAVGGVFTPGYSLLPITTTGTHLWQNIRKKFLVRSTHLTWRMYSTTPGNDNGTVIYALALGFKLMRPGRV